MKIRGFGVYDSHVKLPPPAVQVNKNIPADSNITKTENFQNTRKAKRLIVRAFAIATAITIAILCIKAKGKRILKKLVHKH